MLLDKLQITKTIEQLRPSIDWAFRDAGRSETTYITHGYHRYPAKFIPNIVQKLVEDYTSKGDLIVDPFGGCGTSLVEAKVSGRSSYGFDINPVAKLITQTKITPIYPKTLKNSFLKFNKYYDSTEAVLPEIRNERLLYWFDEQTLRKLNQIYTAIKQIKNFSVRRFYLCAFSHILKNCSRWLMKSIKPTVDKEKTPISPIEVFTRHIKQMTQRNNQFFELLKKNRVFNTPTKVRIADSTKELPLKSESVDLVITSPPYVTSYEYADLHQLSLLWFGNDNEFFKKWSRHIGDFDSFRKKFVGTSLRKKRRAEILNSTIGESIVNKILPLDVSIAMSIRHYFSDMNKSFKEIFRILKPGGKACIIIGDTVLRGVGIKNSAVAVEQMQNIGFKPINFIKRETGNKLITPWRDLEDGRFTGKDNPNRKRAYRYEFVLVMEK